MQTINENNHPVMTTLHLSKPSMKTTFNDDNAPPKLAKSHIRLRTPLVAKVTTLLSNIALLQHEETQFIPVFSTTGCTPYFSAFPSIFVWEYNVVDLLEARKTRGVWQAAIYRNELSSTQQLVALPSNSNTAQQSRAITAYQTMQAACITAFMLYIMLYNAERYITSFYMLHSTESHA